MSFIIEKEGSLMNNKTKDDELVFNRNEVAKILGISPATILNWEKNGLFTAKRKDNNYRVYSLDDIEVLKKIRALSIEEKMGGKAIKKLLMPKIQSADVSTEYSKKFLGKKWKAYRESMNITLEEVSRQVNISPSYLSKLENNQANASFDLLNKLANFYGGSILDFFEKGDDEKHVVKSGSGEMTEIGLPGVTIESLISQKSHALDSMLFTIEPGSNSAEAHKHHGEEFIYVLSGKLRITLNNKDVYHLTKGDSMYFKSSDLHFWENPGSRLCKLLWVHSHFESGI